jgi:hypothetical protein
MRKMCCKRCGAEEDRIHGFCSVECENYYDLEYRIDELEAEVTKCHELQDSYCDRIAELKVFIDQLIEAGELLAECSEYEGGRIAWDELVERGMR